ncbi:MAG: CoA transferase [Dehalococcoidales bacterium]|nr:CoA transferase [Dehalococcoidales bacterium]
MSNKQEIKSALLPIRVLDITEGGCAIGGRMFGDVGADVIKIEPPGGSQSRLGPYYKNKEDPNNSLFWMAYNYNKRGITLDIQKPEGQELFRRLVLTADIILESFGPGFMGKLNLGYDDISQIKPDIIYTSITPFGQTGPKAGYKANELTVWASGGFLNDCGDPDRAPVWIGFPQTGLFGGAEGAVGSMTALWHRINTGEGQYVDVSMQEAAMASNMNVLQMWDVNKVEFRRVGAVSFVAATQVKQPIYFRCKDGYIMILALGGNDPYATSSEHLVQWMKDEGMCPEWLAKLDWWKDYNAAVLKQDLADKVGEAIENFTLTKTKDELYEIGAFGKYKQMLVAPVSNTKDISEDVQLKGRNFWVNMEHPELKDVLPYCGPFIRLSESPIEFKRRAPLIGEHNSEIYNQELGLQEADLKALIDKGVI